MNDDLPEKCLSITIAHFLDHCVKCTILLPLCIYVTKPIFSFCLTVCKPPTITTATAKIQNENRQEIPLVDRSRHFCSKVLPQQLGVHEYILCCVRLMVLFDKQVGWEEMHY